MKYLSKEISKKLSDKGIVSESGKHWLSVSNGEKVAWILTEYTTRASTVVPAYTIWDLIGNKENAIKLWGEDYFVEVSYILNLVHQHGENSEEVIKEIEKVL